MDNKLLDELVYGVYQNIEAYSAIYKFIEPKDKAYEEVLRVIRKNIGNKLKLILDIFGRAISE
jgi:hypothetical protein